MKVGDLIKELRKKNRLTQADLAKKLGVAPTAVSAWERNENRPLMDKISFLAELFAVPVSYFFNNSEFEHPNPNNLTIKEERDIATDLERMISDLESSEALAFHGEPMDEETKELMRISLENSLRLAKGMAKQKFNPNKNK